MEENSQENMSIEVRDEQEEEEAEEEEDVTAEAVLQLLENAWLNEKFSPEILPHQIEHVECMLQQISHMERNLKGLSNDDVRATVHRLELERIRFVVCSYLRTRLEKIEMFTVHILAEEAKRSSDEAYLTPGELKYAKDYVSNIQTLFKEIALRDMPSNFQSFEVSKLHVPPNTNAHVFLRSNKKITGIMLPDSLDEEVNFDVNSQHIIRYSAVADLVKNGDVQLI